MKNRRTLTQLLSAESEEEQKAKRERLLPVLTDSEVAGRERIPCRLTHGHNRFGKRSPEYRSWANMKTRCTNPNLAQWKDYGGRGINFCKRWEDFQLFLEDMGCRPEGTTLDRINPNGNYEPGNCKWSTRAEQNNNRRDNHLVELEGQIMTLKRAADLLGIHRDTAFKRIKKHGNLHTPETYIKLSSEDVGRIKLLLKSGYSQVKISEMYGVSHGTIWDIHHGRSWKLIPVSNKYEPALSKAP